MKAPRRPHPATPPSSLSPPPAGIDTPTSTTTPPSQNIERGDDSMGVRNPSPLRRVLARLPSAELSRGGYKARCPSHVDFAPSLSIAGAEDGRVLVHCFAGCDTKNVVAELGLTMKDLFRVTGTGKKRGLREGVSNPPVMPETLKPSRGLTLAQYSEAKKLPLDFLNAGADRHVRPRRRPRGAYPLLR
jgi:hypothetical protein